ncbi:MAG: hypothetical protein UV38_C0002G0197 [candidate division TM6 bacterium GW2011_GWE2_42_60]|nr:MAG: hypothetical protein UV38_C0002G0197 [candidate division TM6 bacterium GW2011_GWE2_42_60]
MGLNSYTTLCPAHNDQNPSLSLSQGANGNILLHCHAGCSTQAICDAIGIRIQDLFHESTNTPMKDKEKITRTEYPYKDEHGNILYTKVRIEPGFNGNRKSFFWEQKDKQGNIIKNRTGCRKVLYNLPEVLKAIENGQQIFLVEGEKDVDRLTKERLVATTATESTEWNEGFTNIFKNADVVLLFDYDKAGFTRRDLITANLTGKVKSLRIVDLPDLEYKESHGDDVSDWLNIGNSSTWLLELVEKTREYKAPPSLNGLQVISLDELFSLELPARTMLLSPFLPSQGLVLLVAKRGVGKTHVALGIAYAVASGGTFLLWSAPEPKKVLYVDGEMPAVLMQERLRAIASMNTKKPDPKFLLLLTPDLQSHNMPDLSLKDGRDALEPLIEDTDLIIIDNLSCLFRSGSENESESWQEAQEWSLGLRRRGKSVLFVHHAGKNGKQRGTSKKEDILDAVIILEHPDNYKPEEGARFDVVFDKSRHFSGEDARPFHAQLKTINDTSLWEVSNSPKDEDIAQVAALKRDGKTIKEITQTLKLTKAQVEWRTVKAKELGLL